MKEFQKIIKYVAIAFGIYLAITIISIIVGVVGAIFTGIYGVQMITEQSNIVRMDEELVFSEITRLDLDVKAANLHIRTEGQEFKVETYQVPDTTKIENKDGKLIIKDNNKIFSYKNESSIIIYIPENIKLEEIDLDIGAGRLTIDKLDVKDAEFQFGAGSVEIKNMKSEKSSIECGAGQVIISESELTNTDLDAGIGKVEFSGYIKGNSQVNCGIGEVNLNLDGGKDLYTIKVEKGIGNIKINDESVSNESTTGTGENKISVEGGIGNIKIKM